MKEQVLFQREYEENAEYYADETDSYDIIMQRIESSFEPSVFIGTVGRWNGTFNGYKYLHEFKNFKDAIGGYDDIIIRQVGTRLYLALIHHDGWHEMELRRLSDYGYDNRDNVCFDYFNEAALRFINRNTRNYGKV